MELKLIIQNKSLSDQIYEILKDNILKNYLRLGKNISVDEIAKKYNVSHTPAREALSKLKEDGLVISKKNRVHKIFNITEKELIETMEIRKMCECYSIGKAIKSVKKEKFESILKSVVGLENFRKKDITSKFFSVDLIFHKTIIEGANNLKLLQIYNKIYFIIETVIYRIDNKEKDINDFMSEHIEILSLILKNDCNQAKKMLEKHLDHSTNYYLKNFM